jgi:hypothetical protein
MLMGVTIADALRCPMPLFLGERKYNKNKQYPYNCPFCDSSYANARLIQEHMAGCHHDDLQRYDTEAKASISLQENLEEAASYGR